MLRFGLFFRFLGRFFYLELSDAGVWLRGSDGRKYFNFLVFDVA